MAVAFIEYLLEMEKAKQGVSVGNEVQQRASKTSNIVLSGSYTIFTFFFDFSVAFVAGEENFL